MGAFAQAVAALAPLGVHVIPTRPDAPARPMVKAPARIGLTTIRKLAENPRFAGANAAIVTGSRSGITVVDVDEPGDEARHAAIQIFGETPLQVRSPSGGHHLWYRHAGERRSIRPRGLPLAVDVLGGGLAACPPSHRPATEKKAAGAYTIIEGGFDEIPHLPPIKWRPANDATYSAPDIPEIGGMRAGEGRNNSLFRIACSLAASLPTEAALLAELRSVNAAFAEPVPDDEIARMIQSVTRYRAEGRLFATGSRVVLGEQSEILACAEYPPAMLLLAYLRTCHGHHHEFAVVPDGLAPVLRQNPKTIRRARDFLIEREFLVRVSQGGRIGGKNVASAYKFGTGL